MNDDDLPLTPNCPRCLHQMEATDDGWECVYCAVDVLTDPPTTLDP